MRLHSSIATALAWSVTLLAICPTLAQDEAALQQLWTSVWANPTEHHAAVKACDTYLSAHDNDPFHVVARSISAWHLLHAGQTNKAASVLQTLVSTSEAPLSEAGDLMARRWLTRIDHQAVRQALSAHYADHIAFPETLDALTTHPAARDLNLTDAFGDRWTYRTTQFKVLSRLKNQQYELTSRRVGARSDLTESLAAAYGHDLDIRPLKRLSAVAGRPTIRFELASQIGSDPARSLDIVAGERAPAQRNIHFVYAGNRVLILSNGDYWAVLGPSNR